MKRRTKIVATLGPASDRPGVLEGMIKAGVNVVRLNFSHGTHEDHIKRVNAVREIAAHLKVNVGILSDLQGPKIRIEKFKNGSVELTEGASFILDSAHADDAGDETRVGIAYKELVNDVKPKDILLLDDGKIVLEVTAVKDLEVYTKVVIGGTLSNRKGINLQGGGLSAPALTDKDREDLICAANFNTDYIAVSFPRNGSDMDEARELLKKAGSQAHLVAKIERIEAVANIDEIILASDAIMIARGDLAVEIGDAKLMGVQKRFILRARELNRATITATQMMESMIENSCPTRAEVMDVSNAVLDGTDAVMLSAESAAGKYPVETVKAMAEICIGAESEMMNHLSANSMIKNKQFTQTDEAIAMSSMVLANHYDVQALVCLTESGTTAMLMSRVNSDIPIYALTRHAKTAGWMTLYRGVEPLEFNIHHANEEDVVNEVMAVLKENQAVTEGDRIIITRGSLNYVQGGTNNLRIAVVE
ncbi:pyruvate kinase [Wohlfahrtiimonas chitiniclastica]|uniref:pyruvate kinase n=1 Tax=Wohlfahrtiimonas chitiniclastica TaxID=400946 RepID=UPI001BCDEB9E|nr:pyruvate kinase [Wohlfahrtiimonas chitiniclastica]MBS7819090.1 pyruvate kinase [Wohlfahrtiimonas chitiniclastica]MBS7826977.1 pyruvate kinase [Wohlfahrtiimonas chitiniclastica]